MSAARRAVNHVLRRPYVQALLSRTQLYELLSEIGFIRVSARFTDFVYRPLAPTPGMAWVVSNVSVLLENMPLVRSLAGRIVLHAQRPPRNVPRAAVSLCGHEMLRGAVSFVVPCHNEAMNIPALVDGLRGHYGDYVHEIVLVNDNSTDGTAAVIDRLAAEDPRIVPVHRAPPNGVGLALRDGFAAATGRYVMSMDCDFQHLLPEMEDMFDAAAEGADVVFGSRFSRQSVLINYPFGKILANRSFHLLANLVVRLGRRRDITNNLKLMRGELARQLVVTEPWFAANAEIGLQLVLMGGTVREVPISWINRTFDMGQSSFKVLKSGAGYARVLWRFARATRFGRRRLDAGRFRQGMIEVGACPVCDGTRFVEVYPATFAGDWRDAVPYFLTGRTKAVHGRIVRCADCGFLFTSPQFSAADYARIYTAVHAAAAAAVRHRLASTRWRRRVRQTERGGRFLDFGCGGGEFLDAMRWLRRHRLRGGGRGRDAERTDRHRRHPVRPSAIGRPGPCELRLHRLVGCSGAPRRSGAPDAAADDPVETGWAALSHAAEQCQLGRPRVGREMEHAAAGTPLVFRPCDAAAVSGPLRRGGGPGQADPLSGRSGHRFSAGPPDLWRLDSAASHNSG